MVNAGHQESGRYVKKSLTRVRFHLLNPYAVIYRLDLGGLETHGISDRDRHRYNDN